MLRKQKTREVGKNFAGSKTGHIEKIRWKKDNGFCPAIQEKCVRCPYFPGRGYACNLVPCPFTVRGACEACIHFLPVNEHRNKARCAWTGERLNAGEVELLRECIGFEERHFSASDLYPQYPQNCLSEKKTGEGLTSAGDSGKVRFPNLKSHNRRLSLAPQGEKDLFSYSAIHAHTVFSVAHVHIGRVTRPVSARTGGFFKAGERVYPAFLFNPQLEEVPHG